MKQFVKPKRQGKVIDTARMGNKTKITAETLIKKSHPTCETCAVYHEYRKGCPLEWSGWNPKVDYCSNHKQMGVK